MTRDERKQFVAAYLEAALWAETAHGVPEDTPNGDFDTSFESYGFGLDDIAPKAKRAAFRDCLNFIDNNDTALRMSGGSAEQHGHDFWFTRNRHGAGFWDRGYKPSIDKALTTAAHAYGGCFVYVGDDGKIWGF